MTRKAATAKKMEAPPPEHGGQEPPELAAGLDELVRILARATAAAHSKTSGRGRG